MERDGKRQGCKHGPQKLTCQKEKKKKKAQSASRTPNFVFNKFALTWETRVLSGDDFCDLFSVHGFVSQTLDGRSARLSTKEPNDESREASLFGVLRRLPDNHQLMNDLFVTQIENRRRSRVLLASEKDCRVYVSLSESCDLRCGSASGPCDLRSHDCENQKKKQPQNPSRASSTLRQNLSGLVSILTVLSAERFPFPSDFSSVGFGSQRSSSAATLCVAALGSCVGAFAQGRSPLAPLVILLQRRN